MKRSGVVMGRDAAPAIPDLCTPGSVFLLTIIGLTVAVFYTLSRISQSDDFWLTFGLAVPFLEWVVLLSAAILCAFRSRVWSWSSLAAGLLVIAVVTSVTVFASMTVIFFADVPDQPSGWFVVRNAFISLLASLALVRYLVLQQRWKQQVAAETRSRLDALQSSIRPHFLFNSLNTIASLVHDRPDAAEQATLDLSDLIRTGLKSGAMQTLEAELDLVRGYLRLEALRFGDRLQIDWDLDEALPLDLEIPALLIQPLVENAVVHGIARLPSGGKLSIRGKRITRGRLRFEIVNPVPAESARPAESNRMALDNIRQRLALAYEEGARLKTRREDGYFRVELTVPA